MYPHGTIYQSGKSKVSGDVNLRPSRIKKIGYHFLRTLGTGLITFSLVGIIFSFWPIAKAEFMYRFGPKNQIDTVGIASDVGKAKAAELGLDPYFSIYIPKINAKAKRGEHKEICKDVYVFYNQFLKYCISLILFSAGDDFGRPRSFRAPFFTRISRSPRSFVVMNSSNAFISSPLVVANHVF